MATGKRILCIDDSNTTLLLLEYALTEAGYTALLALNVEEAIRQIEKQVPDLILLDLSMPAVSGYDFLKMRDKLHLGKVPVIVISAFDSADSIASSRELGAVEFVSKPIRIDMLLQMIASYMK